MRWFSLVKLESTLRNPAIGFVPPPLMDNVDVQAMPYDDVTHRCWEEVSMRRLPKTALRASLVISFCIGSGR